MQINGLNRLTTDVLIIGGGTAGCYAALTIREKSDASIIIAEKANIKRSGCLAAGVNAINAYIVEGRKPEDYVEYAKKDADDIVREDLLLTMSERLNEVTAKMEKLGLVILKDENGRYVARGNRNIKINGENIKPILADAVNSLENVIVINRLNITDYIVKDNTILGAVGFNIDTGEAYEIRAKKVLCATGGAAGLYKPNNPGFSRHKMWYPPFNTGAGFAMGINAGAEMTTFEMRFIALRCKDTIAPTGTIAQGVGAKQVNSLGEVYENRYGLTTSQRVYGTVRENIEGRGPCYLRTEGISSEQDNPITDPMQSPSGRTCPPRAIFFFSFSSSFKSIFLLFINITGLIFQILCNLVDLLADIYAIFDRLIYNKLNLRSVSHINRSGKLTTDKSFSALQPFDRILLCLFISEYADICFACFQIRRHFHCHHRCHGRHSRIFDPATQYIAQFSLNFRIYTGIFYAVFSH